MDIVTLAAIISAVCAAYQTIRQASEQASQASLEQTAGGATSATRDTGLPPELPAFAPPDDLDVSQEQFDALLSAFNSFGPAEVESIANGLAQCRTDFVRHRDGRKRVECICAILDEVKVANGGSFPDIDNWRQLYTELCG